MYKYYKIMTIQDRYHNIVDTLRHVAKVANISYKEVLKRLGVETTAGLFNLVSNPPDPRFHLDRFIIRRLNDICKEKDLELRIVDKPLRGLKI